VASVVTIARPAGSTPIQNDVDPHEISVIESVPPPSAVADVQVGAEAVGLVELSASAPPAATHREPETQETPPRACEPAMFATVHVGIAAVGFVEMTELPDRSTATHSDVEPHDTPLRKFEPSMFATVQVGDAALGFVETALLPC
jgi:hypothetical protein